MSKSRCNPDKILTDWWMKYYEREYDLDGLLLIPVHRERLRDMRPNLEEWIAVMTQEPDGRQYGIEDYTFTLIYGRYRCPLDTYDPETKTVKCDDGKQHHLNPKSDYDMGQFSNIVVINPYGEYDFKGELIREWELEEMLPEHKESYLGKTAIRIKDKKCIIIGGEV